MLAQKTAEAPWRELRLSQSLACEICGSSDITNRLKKKLNIEPGETTPDDILNLIFSTFCIGK